MTEYNSLAITADFAGTVDQEVEDMIDQMSSLMEETINASAHAEVPRHMQTAGIYDALRSTFHSSVMVSDAPTPIMTDTGEIDIDATVRRAADHLFHAAFD